MKGRRISHHFSTWNLLPSILFSFPLHHGPLTLTLGHHRELPDNSLQQVLLPSCGLKQQVDVGLTTPQSSVWPSHSTLCHHKGVEWSCLNNWSNLRNQQHIFPLQNLNLYPAFDSSHGLRKKYQKGRLFLWGFHHGHKPVPREAPSSPNFLFFPLCRAMTSSFKNLTYNPKAWS